jgi:hypothetical protein|tara:strand:- start:64 stop:723 length:660 start_codon:yes stop_codon:yes gene_type:complete
MNEVPRVKFILDEAVRVTFIFDDVRRSVHDQYGTSYNYTVSSQHVNGDVHEKAYMRVTEILHKRLLDTGAGKGAVMDIQKIQLPDSKSGWEVSLVTPSSSPGLILKDWDGNAIGEAGAAGDAFSKGATAQSLGQSNFGKAAKKTNMTIDDGAALLEVCLYKAEEIWQRVCALGDRDYANVDATTVQASAATIMIWADKKGLTADDLKKIEDTDEDIEFS